jgi:hypothetical protein
MRSLLRFKAQLRQYDPDHAKMIGVWLVADIWAL